MHSPLGSAASKHSGVGWGGVGWGGVGWGGVGWGEKLRKVESQRTATSSKRLRQADRNLRLRPTLQC